LPQSLDEELDDVV